MATEKDFRRIALALPDTTHAPHFERTAFKRRITFATLAPDGLSANLKFTLDEQELKCLTAPDAFAPVPGGWGRMGFTTVRLVAVTADELAAALRLAWAHAGPRAKPRAQRP